MTIDKICEKIKQFRKNIRIVRYNVQGSCKKPLHGKCDVKSYMKSLGYGNITFEWYAKGQGVRVQSVYRNASTITCGFCTDFSCVYAIDAKNKQESNLVKAFSEDFDETFNEANVRCLKCKYHCGR